MGIHSEQPIEARTPNPSFVPPASVSQVKSTVDHPSHYNVGKIEVIDAIEDWGLNFSLGNAVKYIARADHKGKPIEDLQKARWYIEREIERRKKDDSEETRFKFRGDECRLIREGNEFHVNGCCLICDICRFNDREPNQYPCTVCRHGDGEREYFELDERKVEIIK